MTGGISSCSAVPGRSAGGVAGLIGGLFYGFAGAAEPLQPGMGATSVLLVLVVLTMLVALLGGAGVAFGIAAAGFASSRLWYWSAAGGATGGLIVGAITKLLGTDAFSLLFGLSPGDITGLRKASCRAAVGLGAWLASRGARPRALRRGMAVAALTGGAGGILILLLGGRLMGGSLDLLAHTIPGSRLRLDQIGGLFGESDFGPSARS
jgi:hypothetical protein